MKNPLTILVVLVLIALIFGGVFVAISAPYHQYSNGWTFVTKDPGGNDIYKKCDGTTTLYHTSDNGDISAVANGCK